MTGEEIHELGRLAGAFEGLQNSLNEKHRENQRGIKGLADQIYAHDNKDQAAFQEIFRRLAPLEQQDAVDKAADQKDQLEHQHRHAWQIALISAAATIAAGAVGALVTWWVMTQQHPLPH